MTAELAFIPRRVDGRWQGLTRVLLDVCETPAFVLDADGYVVAANEALLGLLGVSQPDPGMPGGGFVDVETIRRGAAAGTAPLHARLSRRDGGHLVAKMTFRSVGVLDAALRLVRVEWSRPALDVVPVPETDVWYVVRTAPGAEGELEMMGDGARGLVTPEPGARCHARLYGRDTPCAGCKVFAEGTPDDVTFTHLEREGRALVHASASRVDAWSTMVLARTISGRDVGELIRGRLDALAIAARLSTRERDVLELTVFGRTHAEIGLALAIAPRTVKHHMANLCRKLGADAKGDLLRILL